MQRANLKSVFYEEEMVRVGSDTLQHRRACREPRYYVIHMMEYDEQRRNNAFTYLTCQHDDEQWPVQEFKPMDNGPLTPLLYDWSDYPFCFQIVHHFHGANNNSPLQDKLNGLILSNHENYSKVVGTDEYKISTLGVSIYEYLQNLTVDLKTGQMDTQE